MKKTGQIKLLTDRQIKELKKETDLLNATKVCLACVMAVLIGIGISHPILHAIDGEITFTDQVIKNHLQ